jgi:Asp-tRNA(Asn)/Glu-tRNA(Gln) amidotransferase A subunit family amidase
MVSRRRVPPLSVKPLRAVAAALEHPRVEPFVGRAVRAALKGRTGAVETTFPLPPPLPLHALMPSAEDRDVARDLARIAHAARPAEVGPVPGVIEYARAYAQRRTNPEEVAEIFLAAVAESEREPMRMYLSIDAADVRAQAKESACRHAEGRPLSLFDGVPVAVKDEVDQRGHRTTLGTRMPGLPVATEDCLAVARLRAQGALLVGKTNMHELGAGPTGWNAAWGTCKNPWDPRHFPGGSSSGSAASVAAGLTPVALGCDGGGSIRIPAAFCGVVGLKPTFGRVPKRGETPPIAHSVTHIGPIGQTTRDVALMYSVMAGRHDDDTDTHRQPLPSLDVLEDTELSGVTLGLVKTWWHDADPEVARACERARGALEACGARIVDVEIDGLAEVRDVLLATIGAELDHNAWLHDRVQRGALSADTRVGLVFARHLPRGVYYEAQRARARIAAGVWRVLDGVHALLSPTTLQTAPRIPTSPEGVSDVELLMRLLRTTALANLTGQPAISFPVGFDPSGLPIGMQAIGRAWDEGLLLRLAFATEKRRERRMPKHAWPTLPML